ncbi:MAG: feruloyl esterase [Fibrobacter sp.]|uniref:alpha/beta hydrolase family esterase n=1 Tax=Fibrobacter sp. TaxID=35828 RepID=UPI001B2E2898|nr:PHB depolymerase family esterase [Fibrobacter sp.]MBO7061295.1 feruloyl esterase [Fibrobacter sp.]MBO7104832.1 feruloyl esterase [Fibrobacter sp.]
MIGSHVKAIASGVALLSTMTFAWSISGTVVTEAGEGIPQVDINTFNFGGFGTQSDALGNFALSSDGASALTQDLSRQVSVHYTGKVLTMEGLKAQTLKVAVMDALGKVVYDKEFREIYGSLTLDLNKVTGQRTSFLRITTNGSNSTYMLTAKGALLKEGDLLPMLMFAKAGFQSLNYQMQAENEAGVRIVMKVAAATGSSSSIVAGSSSSSRHHHGTSSSSITSSNPGPSQQSSSSVAPTSSETPATVTVDCSGKTAKVGDKQNMDVTVDGKKRTFIMHIPNAYKGDKPVPLVIDYHPIGGSGNGEFGSSPYKAKTDPEGVITLYPDGTSKPGGMGNGWNVGPCCSNDDDVKFSYAMIEKLKEIACIDPQRIYATGFSMGGGMSNHVACMMSDVFAAVAPAAMDLNKTNSAACKMARPISVINFRGTNDPVCRYQGGDSGFNDGLNFLGAEGTFRFWAEKNGCTGSPTKNSNGCDEYSNCQDGTKVVLCTKQGGGHDYGDASIGWPFLKQFTLPASFVK